MILGQEDPLEKGMAIHSNILAWRIPWTEVPDGLQSLELQRVGHDSAINTNTHVHTVVFQEQRFLDFILFLKLLLSFLIYKHL